jgi:tetratricopeptide (TPR) repeat protein
MACFLHDRLAGDDFLWSFGRLLAGRAGELVGRYDLARPYYENATRAPNPDHAIAAELGLADCHAVLGNYREAVVLYRRVMSRNHPLHSPLATVQLAKALRDSGRQQEADQVFHEAVSPLAGLPIGQRVAQLLQYSRVVDLWWHDYRQGFPDAAVVDE